MISESKLVTIIGIVIAIAAAFASADNIASLSAIFGENAAGKVGAIGAVIAGIGGSILNILKAKVTP